MKNNQEILQYLNRLQQEITSLHAGIQKYRQDTQYCCLKLGVKDWMHFLTDIRTGNIIYFNHNKIQKVRSQNEQHTETNQNISTFKTVRKTKFQYQSPICSEARIARIKGGYETQRSQSSQHNQMQKQYMSADNFKKDKINSNFYPIIQGQTVESILRYIQDYQAQKNNKTQATFDTFRKKKATNQEDHHQYKKVFANILKNQSHKEQSQQVLDDLLTQKLEIIQSLKQSQYMLALQNTKLRRQIKEKDQLIKKYTITLII